MRSVKGQYHRISSYQYIKAFSSISSNILVLIITFSLTFCSKEVSYIPPRPNYWGSSHLKINGDSLATSPYAYWSSFNENTLTIDLDHRNENDEMRVSLLIYNVPPQKGVFSITTGILEPQITGVGSLLGTYLEDGDVAGDIFRFESTLDSSIVEISEVDTLNNEVKGSFHINLVRDKKYVTTPGFPDTLLVRGDFFTKVTEFH